MKRRVAALLACVLIAFGQRRLPDAQPSTVVLAPLVIDAVAIDASGRPVTDLTADDFEVLQGDTARKVTHLNWFDTKLHMSAARTGRFLALELMPDEIRRTLVVVVDDLGLTPAGINAVRGALEAFVAGTMSSGDRMAILRTSAGSSVLEQLTGDSRTLVKAIEGIQYLGGSTSAASAGHACWLTLRYALEGLRNFAGRKTVVLFAEHPEAIGPSNGGMGDALRAANSAAAAVYALAPLSAQIPGSSPSLIERFARDTGGAFGGSFNSVLQSEQGYYAIGFQREDNPADASGSAAPATLAVVKVRRPGVTARWRAGYISLPPRVDFQAPMEPSVSPTTALTSPFVAADIPVRLTALFSDYPAGGPILEAIAHFYPRDLSVTHDLQGMYHGGAQLKVVAYRDDGRSTIPLQTTTTFVQSAAERSRSLENGMDVLFHLNLPAPGAWQIRAVVVDEASDRVGSATQFVEVPNVREHPMAISGLLLSGDAAAKDPQEGAGVRMFQRGANCAYRYSVFNAITGLDRHSAVEVQTRILAAGRVVFDGKSRVDFEEAPVGARRQIIGRMKLSPEIRAGYYILQVTVRDLLAPAGEPRIATQFTDFLVRE